MARRPRQTAKGTTAKNKMETARTTLFCLWRIREKGQKPTVPTRRTPCWDLGLQYPRPGTTGLRNTMRIRAWDSTVPTRRQPRWAFGSAMPHYGNTRPRHFGPVASPCGNTRFREHDASSNPWFSPRVLFNRWRKFARNCLNCARTIVKKPWCQPIGSRVGRLGLHDPLWKHQSSALWACSVPLWEHQASGAGCESEPTVSRVVASSLFGVKLHETALTAPEGGGGSDSFLLDERCDSSVHLRE